MADEKIAELQAQIAKLQQENEALHQLQKQQQQQVPSSPSLSSSSEPFTSFKYIEDFIGNTPLVRLRRIPGIENDADHNNNVFLVKLEGNNPGSSVKDRPAMNMIRRAEERGELPKNDPVLREKTYILEATSGNTGIGLAMAAAIAGYKSKIIMPANSSEERKQTMRAFGAELILVSKEEGMEGARDLAEKMMKDSLDPEKNTSGDKYVWLDQFSNEDNPAAHFATTGPEIWRDTNGTITHFCSSAGTHGTAMGVSRFLKSKNKDIKIIKCEPTEGSSIPGIRKWPVEYLPKIFNPDEVDAVESVSELEANTMMKRLAKEEGIFCGPSSGGGVAVALRLAKNLKNAVIVSIICDRGDRYLSTGSFN